MNKNVSREEDAFFTILLIIGAIFFFQEYFYFFIPNHEPFWIAGIPLTIIGILGLFVFMIWFVFRGNKKKE